MLTNHSPFLTAEHDEFRQQARRFVEREVMPNVERWEAQGKLPRELHRKTAQAGLLGLDFSAEHGGIEVPDPFYGIVRTQEFARAGAGGVIASLFTHGIACPPIDHAGTPEQKRRFLAPVLAGEKKSCANWHRGSSGSTVALYGRCGQKSRLRSTVGGSAFGPRWLRSDLYRGVVEGSDTSVRPIRRMNAG